MRMDQRVVDQSNRTHRLREASSESHLLALRFQDGDHSGRFPIQRRVRVGDRRYGLAGLYMGQKKCGHQIGVVCPSGDWRDWMIVDADLHKDGISPVFIRFEGPEWNDRWWEAWRELVHVTKYGNGSSEFCNLSRWNPVNHSLDKFSGASVGTNSIDAVYVPLRDYRGGSSQTRRGVEEASPLAVARANSKKITLTYDRKHGRHACGTLLDVRTPVALPCVVGGAVHAARVGGRSPLAGSTPGGRPSTFLPLWIADDEREHVVRHALYAIAFTVAIPCSLRLPVEHSALFSTSSSVR